MNRTYSRQVIAAWLHGYTTGHSVGWYDGRVAGFGDGYDDGHTAGLHAGYLRCWAEQDALWARIRTDTRQLLSRPSHAELRARPYAPAKPMQTSAECLATWPTAAPAIRHAA